MDELSELYNELLKLGMNKHATDVGRLIRKHADDRDYLTDDQLKAWKCDSASIRGQKNPQAKSRGDKMTDSSGYKYTTYPCEWLNPIPMKKPDQFTKIPGGIYRSDQYDLNELEWILANNPEIQKVLRFSGPKEKLPHHIERDFLRSRGVDFEFINVHDDDLITSNSAWTTGKDRSCGHYKPVSKIIDKLKGGGVLVHCRAGRDRAGSVIGAHLVYNQGMSPADAWDIVKKLNGPEDGSKWRTLACSLSGQASYLAAFYPIELWCMEQLTERERVKCRACRPGGDHHQERGKDFFYNEDGSPKNLTPCDSLYATE
jgi:hypothetical protein